ncbi:MAG: VWA domain-containing protein, partial [Candidatus Solibacter sp.]|nr:VWA domain-containing protein [Candidatus Solibacter sp.]
MKAISMALILVLLAGAQQPVQTPQGAANGVVKFQANTQLVIETVTVKDKDGKPVEGLTAKDFTITEDGVLQTISFCEYQTLDEIAPPAQVRRTEAAPAAAVATPAIPGVTAHQITPERPGDIRYRDRRLMAMYFDMSAMPVPDQIRAETAAMKFIQKQMLPADLMAIMSFNGASVQVLQDFTDKREDLEAVINKLFIADAGMGENANDESTADTGAAFGQDDSEFNLFTTDRQLGALQTAVKMLGQLNEKKVLVYFASGLNLNGIDNQAQFQATTNAAIRANVSFYPVDARGLVAQS